MDAVRRSSSRKRSAIPMANYSKYSHFIVREHVSRALLLLASLVTLRKQRQVPSGLFPAQRGAMAKGNLAEKGMVSGGRGSWTLAFWIYLLDNAEGRCDIVPICCRLYRILLCRYYSYATETATATVEERYVQYRTPTTIRNRKAGPG